MLLFRNPFRCGMSRREFERKLMASVDEVKALAVENAAAVADTKVRLSAINVKIDALVAAGGGATPAQIDELAALGADLKASFAGVSAELADAEQS